jgi:hypothetical protein
LPLLLLLLLWLLLLLLLQWRRLVLMPWPVGSSGVECIQDHYCRLVWQLEQLAHKVLERMHQLIVG